MAATTTMWMSVEEFSALPDDGQMHELVEGAVQTMPPPGFVHSHIVSLIFESIALFLQRNRLGRAFAEGGFLLSTNPPTVRQPDIGFVKADRMESQFEGIYFPGAPDLAIEVVSPSDRAGDLDLKVRQYLAAGARAVAVVYPLTRSIWLHCPEASPHLLTVERLLEVPEILPGWSIAVADVFAPLDRASG